MAYIFPVNPYDGQLYPIPAVPGALQYQWSASQQVWLIFSPLGVQSVTGILPIVVSNGTADAVVSIQPATINTPGSMSAADKAKLDNIPANANTGTVTQITTGSGLSGGPITTTGQIDLEPASKTTEGGVIIGDNIDVSTNGTISIPTARFGVTSINIGPGLVGAPAPLISTGTISAALATRLTIGSVRIGNGINVTPDGTISVGGALANAAILAYACVQVTPGSNPPVFTITESYNVSAVSWVGTTAYPAVRVTFQSALANANYGLLSGAQSATSGYPTGTYPQRSQLITLANKTDTFVDLQLVTFSTGNWTTNLANSFFWNDWGGTASTGSGGPSGLVSFDIALIDTPVF